MVQITFSSDERHTGGMAPGRQWAICRLTPLLAVRCDLRLQAENCGSPRLWRVDLHPAHDPRMVWKVSSAAKCSQQHDRLTFSFNGSGVISFCGSHVIGPSVVTPANRTDVAAASVRGAPEVAVGRADADCWSPPARRASQTGQAGQLFVALNSVVASSATFVLLTVDCIPADMTGHMRCSSSGAKHTSTNASPRRRNGRYFEGTHPHQRAWKRLPLDGRPQGSLAELADKGVGGGAMM
jgi:hypothetical protein